MQVCSRSPRVVLVVYVRKERWLRAEECTQGSIYHDFARQIRRDTTSAGEPWQFLWLPERFLRQPVFLWILVFLSVTLSDPQLIPNKAVGSCTESCIFLSILSNIKLFLPKAINCFAFHFLIVNDFCGKSPNAVNRFQSSSCRMWNTFHSKQDFSEMFLFMKCGSRMRDIDLRQSGLVLAHFLGIHTKKCGIYISERRRFLWSSQSLYTLFWYLWNIRFISETFFSWKAWDIFCKFLSVCFVWQILYDVCPDDSILCIESRS